MNLLPIGSVILLKNANKRLMIYGLKQVNTEDGSKYDYIGCVYPEGNIGPGFTYLFNHEDIVRVDFVGFVDSEAQLFRAKLEKELVKKV